MKWFWQVFDDVVPVGQNPEYADMSNPQGYIFGRIFYLTGTDKFGNRVVSSPSDNDGEYLSYLAELWNSVGAVPSETDRETYPEYGSSAYLDSVQEEIYNERNSAW